MGTIPESFRKCGFEKILELREKIGLLKEVCIVTRTWSGERVGDGSACDEIHRIKPQPGIREYAHDLRILEGGTIKQGDIVIRGISKSNYPESEIDNSSNAKNVERLYLVGDKLYQLINISERHLTWDVQVRRLSDQTRHD